MQRMCFSSFPKRKLSLRVLKELWVEQLCLPMHWLTSGILICNQNNSIKVEDTSNCIIVQPWERSLSKCVDYSLPLPPPPTSLSFSHILPTCTYVALCNPGAGCCDESGPPWGMCKQLQCQCWEHKTPGDLCSWHDVSVSATCTDPLVMNIFSGGAHIITACKDV